MVKPTAHSHHFDQVLGEELVAQLEHVAMDHLAVHVILFRERRSVFGDRPAPVEHLPELGADGVQGEILPGREMDHDRLAGDALRRCVVRPLEGRRAVHLLVPP